MPTARLLPLLAPALEVVFQFRARGTRVWTAGAATLCQNRHAAPVELRGCGRTLLLQRRLTHT
eukprot:365980-Chlamydomonas_euryale.AAC.11